MWFGTARQGSDMARMLGCFMYGVIMNKRELIDRIMKINHTARPEFLAKFKEEHLTAYLHHLTDVVAENQIKISVFADIPEAFIPGLEEKQSHKVTA